MNDRIQSSLSDSEPPADLSSPLKALWWLKKGGLGLGPEWDRAHGICQTEEGTKAYDWVHGLAHWIEGDESNANYWYRRVGENRAGANTAEEWDHLVARLNE